MAGATPATHCRTSGRSGRGAEVTLAQRMILGLTGPLELGAFTNPYRACVLVLLGMLAAGCALRGGTVPLGRRLPTVTVTCVVLTAENGSIPDARCQSEGVGATTDEHGVAVLRGVPVGDRLLVVTATGYDAGSQPYTASTTDLTVRVHLRARPAAAVQ
jgi:hypothetical protein